MNSWLFFLRLLLNINRAFLYLFFAGKIIRFICLSFARELIFIVNSKKNIRKNIFACLFSIHNTISLSRHEQVYLSGLRFERYFPDHRGTWKIMSAYLKEICGHLRKQLNLRIRSCAMWLIKIIGQIIDSKLLPTQEK